MAYSLPLSDCIETAWQRVRGSKGPIMLAFIFQLLLGIKTNVVLIDLLFAIGSALLSASLLYMGIIRARQLPIEFSLVFSGFTFHVFLNVIGYFLIAMLAVIIMILPPVFIAWYTAIITFPLLIFAALRTFLTLSFIVDRKLSIFPALKASYLATSNNVWRIIVLNLFMMLTIIGGFITLFIGLIWAIPFCYILWGIIYENLAQHNLDSFTQPVTNITNR